MFDETKHPEDVSYVKEPLAELPSSNRTSFNIQFTNAALAGNELTLMQAAKAAAIISE